MVIHHKDIVIHCGWICGGSQHIDSKVNDKFAVLKAFHVEHMKTIILRSVDHSHNISMGCLILYITWNCVRRVPSNVSSHHQYSVGYIVHSDDLSIFIMIRSFENVIHMQMQSMLKQQHIYPRHWHVNYALRWRQCSIKLCCSLRLSKTIAKIKLFTNWFTCFTSKFYKSEIQQHTADRV